MMNIRKSDTVLVITGKDKGKKATVLEVLPDEGKILLQGINVATLHKSKRAKSSQQSVESSGIKKKEAYLDISKAMPICPSCKVAARVNATVLDSGKKARVCNNCKEIF